MVYHRAADHEGIAKMHTRHRGERIHVITSDPNPRGTVMADRVQEAVFGREQARGHARVEGEGQKGQKIRNGHGATEGGKCGVRWGDVVVPGYEAARGTFSFVRTKEFDGCYLPNGTWNMDQCIRAVEDGQSGLVSVHKPVLHIMLRPWEEKAQPAELLEFQHRQAMIFRNLPY